MGGDKKKFYSADRRGLTALIAVCAVLAVLIVTSVFTRRDEPGSVSVPAPIAASADSVARMQDSVAAGAQKSTDRKRHRIRKPKQPKRPVCPHERDYLITPEQEADRIPSAGKAEPK